MTASARRQVSVDVPDLPDPVLASPAHHTVSRWAWAFLILVLVAAVAGTVALLLVEWTAQGSGTVAR